MKSPYLVLFLGAFVALIGGAASFASAPQYGYLFATTIVCDLIALSFFVHLFRLGGGWMIAALLPSVFVLYTFADVVLRILWGARVLDVMHW